jgi:transporter family-2 protein
MPSITEGPNTAFAVAYFLLTLCVALLLGIWRSIRDQAGFGLTWYLLRTGLIGVTIAGTYALVRRRMDLVSAMVVVTVGQLIIGSILDHFGWLGTIRKIDVGRGLGIILLVLGTWLILE